MQAWEFMWPMNGPNWCHAPNVRISVWNQCLEQFAICLMCPYKQKGFMELGSLDAFMQDGEHCQMREQAVSHGHFLCLDFLGLTNRLHKSWMQVPVSRSQEGLPSWECFFWGEQCRPMLGLVGYIDKVATIGCIYLVSEHLAHNIRVSLKFRSYPFLA